MRKFKILSILLILTILIVPLQAQKTSCGGYYKDEKISGVEGDYYFLNNAKADVAVYYSNGTLGDAGYFARVNGSTVGSAESLDQAFVVALLYQYNSTTSNDVKIACAKSLKNDFGYDISTLKTSGSSSSTVETTTASEAANDTASTDDTVTEEVSSSVDSASNKTAGDDKAVEDKTASKNTNDSSEKEEAVETTQVESSETTGEAGSEENVDGWTEKERIEATCTTDGSITYENTLTGETKTDVIKATGHSEGSEETIVSPTLFSKGISVVRCSKCDEVLEEKELPATFPVWGYAIPVVLIALGGATFIILRRRR